MPRQARLDAAGTLHHVIIRGIERRHIVKDDEDRRAFVSRLGRLASETDTAIYIADRVTLGAQWCRRLVQDHGIALALAEMALEVGVSTSAISKILTRGYSS